jgi:hypothetical protein
VEKGFGKMILQFTPDFENALLVKEGNNKNPVPSPL